MNVPRHLPFKIGKVKEAACGGTGNVVLTGEFISRIVHFGARLHSSWIVTHDETSILFSGNREILCVMRKAGRLRNVIEEYFSVVQSIASSSAD